MGGKPLNKIIHDIKLKHYFLNSSASQIFWKIVDATNGSSDVGGFSADLRSQCFHVACRGILLRSTGAKKLIRTNCQCQDFDFDYMENRTVTQHKAVEQRFLHFISSSYCAKPLPLFPTNSHLDVQPKNKTNIHEKNAQSSLYHFTPRRENGLSVRFVRLWRVVRTLMD